MLKCGDLTDLLVPALNQSVEPVHELRVVLNAIVELVHLHYRIILLSPVELGLDFGVDRQLDHGNLHVLARLLQVSLQVGKALEDAF